jgi:hypothetical protein
LRRKRIASPGSLDEVTVRVLAALLFFACASPALAEVWTVREGECGEWQARWVVDQERSGVWSGSIEQIHIGGPCERRTSRIRRSNVRAVIHGDNVFAVRTTDQGSVCLYAARRTGDGLNRARGVFVCEGRQRQSAVFRFRSRMSPSDALSQIAPDDEIWREQSRGPRLRLEFRGLEELFGR